MATNVLLVELHYTWENFLSVAIGKKIEPEPKLYKIIALL